MSLKVFNKQKNESLVNFYSIIKNETGVTIGLDDGHQLDSVNEYHYLKSITFSDGKSISDLYSGNMYRSSDYIVLVDDVTHLFIQTTKDRSTTAYQGSSNQYRMESMYYDFIIEKGDGVLNLTRYNGSYFASEAFNIPTLVNSKGDIPTIKLLQAYSKDCGYVKNTYINYDRTFLVGLKFVDQNNNEFITLGGFLLYYNGKHK